MDIENFLNIIILFVFYCFLGWIWESTYESIIDRKILNRGFLFGPYIPIYGFGGIAIYFGFNKYSTNLFNIRSIEIYFIGLLIATILEYVTSFLLEKIFGARWWDYSGYKLNINGRICLIASLFWGVVAVIFVQVLNPKIISVISSISHDLKLVLATMFITTIGIDTFYTIFSIINLKEKIDSIIELQDVKFANTIDKLSSLPNNTKIKVEEHLEKLYDINNFYIKRLLSAFPKVRFLSSKKQHILNKIREHIKKN